MKVVAKALVFDNDKNVLLLQRSNSHPNFAGHFDFPGGEVEPGEAHVNAMQRELEEETGLKVLPEELTLVYEKQISPGLIHAVYVTNVPHHKPVVKLSWEHQGFDWRPYRELQNIPIPEGVDNYYLTVCEYLDSRLQ